MKKTAKTFSNEVIEKIRSEYGYRTKAALCRELKLKLHEFDRILRENDISSQNPETIRSQGREIDFSQLMPVRIPGPGNCVAWVKKHKNPLTIIQKYEQRPQI